jgi:DNA uptake protein ComE-like DNA-binding protein
MNPTPPSAWSWTPRNLTAVALLTGLLLGLAVWRAYQDRARLDSDLVARPAAVTPAEEKVDPNTASWVSLARLPEMGPTRAKAIVKYRDQVLAGHPGEKVFARPEDLVKVPGIGTSIVDVIQPHLEFEQAKSD